MKIEFVSINYVSQNRRDSMSTPKPYIVREQNSQTT